MEILKAPLEREKEDVFELSLELSIGGSYGKSDSTEKMGEGKKGDAFAENNNGVSRSDFSRGEKDDGCEFVDLQKKRKIQAFKSEHKLVLEAQQFQARVIDGENREKNGVSENPVRKKFHLGRKMKFAWELWGMLNGALERGYSADSDYQSMSHKVDRMLFTIHIDDLLKCLVLSDSGETHSSSFCMHQNQCASRSDKVELLEINNSNSQTEPDQCFGRVIPEQCKKMVSLSIPQLQSSTSKTIEKSKASSHSNRTNNVCSKTDDSSSPPSKQTSGLIKKPPKPPNHKTDGVSVQNMPRVSTTGNGPNGKTITGFLYKYTKTEVSIICVCHRRSFSPAEFVEHAGGVDILNPLRHITIVPSALR
ncbi:hypothetical protein DH2020_024411 [Rehmannia glutinosa]|uniref:Ninja-family protein n=1 Tax=Rehmannia glutinosa TaxID=99300 RepID=A0ABR0W6F3_REHGL